LSVANIGEDIYIYRAGNKTRTRLKPVKFTPMGMGMGTIFF